MSVTNLEKIIKARQQQHGNILESVKSSVTNEDVLKVIEAMFKYMDDSNKAIMAKLEEIDKKVSGDK